MNDVVRLLPDSVANQIAAGEVIQRPASVIKELVENAVDAGATNIKIYIKDAGRTMIQVVDNGCGMSPTDARLAFERHSTSKIQQAEDLFSLHTMGFRGEALASICAVSEVELRTMRAGDSMGTRIVISGSKVEAQEPAACTVGSSMTVKKLFFNVPARRKFLKSDNVEMSHIIHEFERLALVNPQIEFELHHNDTVVHQLLKGSFKQRIVELFGKSLDKQLVPIESVTSLVRISGFVSRPENARKRGALQYLMVNGRNMRHPYFHKAIMMCYDQLIPSDHQPNYFINFEVDPESIDVNIHPTKNEIKFENEQPIWQILTATIKEGLGKFNAVPSIDFDMTNAPDIPVFNPNAGGRHGLDLDPTYNPFKSASGGGSKYAPSDAGLKSIRSNIQDWDKLYAGFTGDADHAVERASSLNDMDFPSETAGTVESSLNQMVDEATGEILIEAESSASAMQLKNRYILTPSSSGLMVIDQHRAHVRILFDRYMDLAKLDALNSQRSMFPEMIQLTASESVIMEKLSEELSKLGFDISYLGDSSWSVNGMPSVLQEVNSNELVMSMIDTYTATGAELGDSLRSKIALSMAKSAAVKAGQSLTVAEMEHIVSDLFKLASPNYTPDGHPVMSIISLDDIVKLFN